MKRCPQCNEAYDDSDKFCELDGQVLYADRSASSDALEGLFRDSASNGALTHSIQRNEVWLVGTAGVLAGIVVCVGGYLLYGILNDDSSIKENTAPAVVSQSQNQIQPSRPPAPRAEVAAPPEETATLEPEASPAPSPAASVAGETVAAHLNQGPVSTAPRKKEIEEKGTVKTIIQMKDGTAVEVDAAWEDKQGVWYRRGGLVSFVESERVKSITGMTTAKSSAEN
jgi:hypothetical protein